jgi:hypothetical protein
VSNALWTWNPIEVVSLDNDSMSEMPAIAVDREKNVHVVWCDNQDLHDTGGDDDMFYRYRDASSGNWSGQVNSTVDLISQTEAWLLPSVAVDATGNIHVAYSDFSGLGGIFYRFWDTSTEVWSGQVNSSDSVSEGISGEQYFPSLAVDSKGNVHIAWYSDAIDDIFYRLWNQTAGAWEPISLVSSESTGANLWRPWLALDGSDIPYIVWEDDTNDLHGSGPDRDTCLRYWNASTATWTGFINSTDIISWTSGAESNCPTCAVDTAGNVHVTWIDNEPLHGSGSDKDIFYKYWNTTTQMWTGRINETDVISCESAAKSVHPKIALDLAGNPHITWSDLANLGWSGDNYHILYKYWNQTLNTWTGRSGSVDVVSGNHSAHCYRSAITIDHENDIHFTWNEAPDGGSMPGDHSGRKIMYRLLDGPPLPKTEPIPGFALAFLVLALIALIIMVQHPELYQTE